MNKYLKLLILAFAMVLSNNSPAAAAAFSSDEGPTNKHSVVSVVYGDSELVRGKNATLILKNINARKLDLWRAFQEKIGAPDTEFIAAAKAFLGEGSTATTGEGLTDDEIKTFIQMSVISKELGVFHGKVILGSIKDRPTLLETFGNIVFIGNIKGHISLPGILIQPNSCIGDPVKPSGEILLDGNAISLSPLKEVGGFTILESHKISLH